ncbi:MAG: DUF4019 domain-containing protein [bacterium]|nr:DUF4019 domain-containing protein [bacterium]
MKKRALLVILLVNILISCSVNFNKQPAIDVMEDYFSKIDKDNLDILIDYYAESMFKETSKEEWKDLLEKIHKKLGDFESAELTSWNLKNMAQLSGSGTYYYFTYKSKYTNSSANEQVTMFKARKSDEIKIVGHHFKSEIFLEEGD